METKKETLNDWDGFISGVFLKAVNVNSETEAFVVTNIDVFDDGDNIRPRITVERNDSVWDFDLNKTNSIFLKDAGIKTPKELIGCKLYFKKALVRNPTTNKEVEGLRICKVEMPTI